MTEKKVIDSAPSLSHCSTAMERASNLGQVYVGVAAIRDLADNTSNIAGLCLEQQHVDDLQALAGMADRLCLEIMRELSQENTPPTTSVHDHCSTEVQRDLDMAAVYAESLKAMHEASRGLDCEQVDVANMLLLLKAAKHLLLAAKGPVGGPTCWDETRRRWIVEYENIKLGCEPPR